jgi:uncharacterized membrane protein YphA (DoxX/SURF4 family)
MPPIMEDKPKTGPAKSFARYLPVAARILMGLPFLAGGIAGLLNVTPQPSTPLPAGAAAFADALVKTGYMMPLIFGTQLIVGALLLANRFVPLALALIAPFLVNAVAFHLFLEPSGRPIVLAFLALEIYLAWAYRKAFRPMLAMRVTPGAE